MFGTAVRNLWMFRTAAIVHVFFGMAYVWKYGFTGEGPMDNPFGSALGVSSILVGVFLFKPARIAIGLSAISAAVVAISAAVGVPVVKGPAIFAFALVAILCGLYAVMAARELFGRGA
jgi:hypothetical protein